MKAIATLMIIALGLPAYAQEHGREPGAKPGEPTDTSEPVDRDLWDGREPGTEPGKPTTGGGVPIDKDLWNGRDL